MMSSGAMISFGAAAVSCLSALLVALLAEAAFLVFLLLYCCKRRALRQ
jgi:hypothetical protein